ncbi:MAG TPA: 50S ribosomal protein L28 [Candidatus Rifleibacterium sp.]|jgi:large subunit ribosomal protein L28|nr:50S ribosomal protein L28 [Candidatus Ozemobacteraceae bacterium]HOI89599.1 50S ribosomal protein L28 [Candidatus Rifleibacterium sp.]
MSRVCMVCNRGPQVGFKLSHSHHRTKRRWSINLQRKRVMLNGTRVRGYVCTRCLGSDKVVAAN